MCQQRERRYQNSLKKARLMEFSPFDSPASLQPKSRWEQIEKLRGKGRRSTGDHRQV